MELWLYPDRWIDLLDRYSIRLIYLSDSRCPPDANCIWPGMVEATIDIATTNTRATIPLYYYPGQIPKRARIGNLILTLLEADEGMALVRIEEN